MSKDRQDPGPDARLQALAEWTEPTEAEVDRVLARRVTRSDMARLDAMGLDAADGTRLDAAAERIRPKVFAAAPPARDPRSRAWANLTEPTARELARVVSYAPDDSVAEATLPTQEEVRRLVEGPVPAHWTELTSPTDHEVAALCARRGELQGRIARQRRRELLGRLIGGSAAGLAAIGAAAVALVLVGLPGPADTYGTPDLPVGVTSTVPSADIVDLGPSIDMTVHTVPDFAETVVQIAQADAQATVVDVLSGGTRFDVDPRGVHRHLTVRARDVEVVVKGTVFTVDTLADAVVVGVERGRVQVTSPKGTIFLTKGMLWRSDSGMVATGAPEPNAMTTSTSSDVEDGVTDSVIATDQDLDAQLEEAMAEAAEAARAEDEPVVAEDPVVAPEEAIAAEPEGTDAAAADDPAEGAANEPDLETTAAAESEEGEAAAEGEGQLDAAPGQAETEGSADGEPDAVWPPKSWGGDTADAAAQTSNSTQGGGVRFDGEVASAEERADRYVDDLSRLHRLDQRNSERASPMSLLRATDRFIQDADARLHRPAHDLRIDIARRVSNPTVFDEVVIDVLDRYPEHPRAQLLHLERGVRWYTVDRADLAMQAYRSAANSDGPATVEALLALATCALEEDEEPIALDALEEAHAKATSDAERQDIELRMQRADLRHPQE